MDHNPLTEVQWKTVATVKRKASPCEKGEIEFRVELKRVTRRVKKWKRGAVPEASTKTNVKVVLCWEGVLPEPEEISPNSASLQTKVGKFV